MQITWFDSAGPVGHTYRQPPDVSAALLDRGFTVIEMRQCNPQRRADSSRTTQKEKLTYQRDYLLNFGELPDPETIPQTRGDLKLHNFYAQPSPLMLDVAILNSFDFDAIKRRGLELDRSFSATEHQAVPLAMRAIADHIAEAPEASKAWGKLHIHLTRAGKQLDLGHRWEDDFRRRGLWPREELREQLRQEGARRERLRQDFESRGRAGETEIERATRAKAEGEARDRASERARVEAVRAEEAARQQWLDELSTEREEAAEATAAEHRKAERERERELADAAAAAPPPRPAQRRAAPARPPRPGARVVSLAEVEGSRLPAGSRVEGGRLVLPPPRAPRAAPAPPPPCVGECGRWRVAPKGSHKDLVALGPTSPVWDASGARYQTRYLLVRPAGVRPSHDPDGRPVPGYPPELQARDRGGVRSRAQVQALAGQLDPDRLIAPSSSPADGAPIGWQQRPGAPLDLVAGNGRAAAWWVRAQRDGRWTWPAYAEAVAGRWSGAPRRLWGDGRLDGLLVVRELLDATAADAVALAAASQASASATETLSERASAAYRSAVSRGWSLFPWPITRPITASSWPGLLRAYPGTLEPIARLVPGGSPTAEASAELANELLWGWASHAAGVRLDPPPELAEAFRALLPVIAYAEDEILSGRLPPEGSLLPPAVAGLQWAQTVPRVSLRALTARAEVDSLQEELFEGASAAEAAPFGLLLIRLSRRADPTAAAGDIARQLAEYLSRQWGDGLFGVETPDVLGELARLARMRRENAGRERPGRVIVLGDHIEMDVLLRDATEEHWTFPSPWVLVTEDRPELGGGVWLALEGERNQRREWTPGADLWHGGPIPSKGGTVWIPARGARAASIERVYYSDRRKPRTHWVHETPGWWLSHGDAPQVQVTPITFVDHDGIHD